MRTSFGAPPGWLLSVATVVLCGCGAAEDGLAWVQSLWSESAEVAEPEVVAPEAVEPESTAPLDVPAPKASSTGGDPGDSGSTAGAQGTRGGSTTIPMSFARPATGSDDSGSGTGGSEDSGGTTGDSGASGDDGGSTTGEVAAGGSTGAPAVPPTGSLPACLEGQWAIDDMSTYYRRVIRGQAHGRAVRTLKTTGRYTLRFRGDDLHGEAKHLRMQYTARLADQDIRYSVDVHGTFDTKVRALTSDTLDVIAVKGASIRAREVARFPGGKTSTRKPTLPVFGRFEFTCTAKTLELRPIEKGKARETIRFVRPKP